MQEIVGVAAASSGIPEQAAAVAGYQLAFRAGGIALPTGAVVAVMSVPAAVQWRPVRTWRR